MNFSVTKFGKKLDPSLYTWNKKRRTFITKETNLLIDFGDERDITFHVGCNCHIYIRNGVNFNIEKGYINSFGLDRCITFFEINNKLYET